MNGSFGWGSSGIDPGSCQVELRGIVGLTAGLAAHLSVPGVGAVLTEHLHSTKHRFVSFTAGP